MRSILLAVAAFSTAIVAQTANGPNPFKVPQGFSLTAGKPTNIQWDPTTSGTVTLRLRDGANSDLNAGTIIGSNLPNNGAFTYTPPANTVRNSDYALEIVSDSDPTKVNYTPQFVIESSNTVASVTSSNSASVSSTTGSSSSASTSASSTISASTTSGSSSSMTSTMSSSTTTSGSSSMTSSTSSTSTSAGSSSTGSSSSSSASASATSAPKNGAAGRSLSVGVALVAVVLGTVPAW